MPTPRQPWLLDEPVATESSFLFLLASAPVAPAPSRPGPGEPGPGEPPAWGPVPATPAPVPSSQVSRPESTQVGDPSALAASQAAQDAPAPAADDAGAMATPHPTPPPLAGASVAALAAPVARALPPSPAWTPDALLLLSFGRDIPPLPPFQPPSPPDGDLHATPGRDTFRFGAGEPGRTIHDFEPGRDRVELPETRIADVAFQTGAWDLRLLFAEGQALEFAGLGRGGHDAVAVIFADGVLSVAEMLGLAATRPADGPWVG